jgi:hypothetical protein
MQMGFFGDIFLYNAIVGLILLANVIAIIYTTCKCDCYNIFEEGSRRTLYASTDQGGTEFFSLLNDCPTICRGSTILGRFTD